MEINGLGFLLILWAVWSIGGMISTYVLTILHGHFKSYLMYISYTGCYSPEKQVFAFVLSVSAVMDAIILYVIYRRRVLLSKEMENNHPWVQNFLLVSGWLDCVGTVLVGAFPVVTHVVPHSIGAYAAFGFAMIHNFADAFLQLKMRLGSRRMTFLRMIVSVLTIMIISTFLASTMGFYFMCTSSECLKITDSIDIIAEWSAAMSIFAYNLTFFYDFQEVRFKWKWSFTEDWLFLREKQQDQEEVP